MTYAIRKAAVIGAGTMGRGIAALLAGAGIETLLLDIPAPDSTPTDPPEIRNQPALNGLEALKNARPPQLLEESDIDRIQPGNTEDDLNKLAEMDWIVEVVFENLEAKRAIMEKVAAAANPTAIISTNTSGIPLHDIAAGMPDDFTRRFLGTHFFNPPRQLRLLEMIPHQNTDPAVRDALENFGSKVLEKGVVWCKDTPNFIGNRFYTMLSIQTINYALDNGFSVAEVDALTGPLIGRPRTATFRLQDLVGIDVALDVARNLYGAITDDPAREILRREASNALFDRLMKRGWLGNKTGQGFYKVIKQPDGEKEYWTLDFSVFDYALAAPPEFDSVTQHGHIENTAERIRALVNEDDRAGRLLWHHHAFYLAYASQRVPEITDSIQNIDNAQKWGFGHEMGPFEIWDALGVAETMTQFEAAGYPVAQWVTDMLADGHATFYERDSAGNITGYADPQRGWISLA
jgi:3-hydroxyacyl-CoA dehydrogenase